MARANKKNLIGLCNYWQNESLTKQNNMAQRRIHTLPTITNYCLQGLRPIGNSMDNATSHNTLSGYIGFSVEKDYPNIGPFYKQLR